MMINKKGTIQLLIITLLFIGYVAYIYLKPDNISPAVFTELNGLLLEKPKYKESNGENVPNIKFRLIGDFRNFKIESCGLKEIDFDLMMNLKQETQSF